MSMSQLPQGIDSLQGSFTFWMRKDFVSDDPVGL